MSETQNFVAGHDIGSAWLSALERVTLRDVPHRYLTIHVDEPLQSLEIPEEETLVEWAPVINAGDVFDEYCDFDFEEESKVEGTTGRAWIESRIYEMYEGLYHDRLQEPDQIEMITERLTKGNHGACTNALVAQVYSIEADLPVATSGRPFAKDMACMTQIQFRPKKDRLHCFATFRSQYMDVKCYGNLIALAMLLGQICDRTGYEPGILVEHANNTISYSRSSSRELLAQLIDWDTQGYGLRMAARALERLGLNEESWHESILGCYGAYILENRVSGYSIPAILGGIICILGDQVDYEVNLWQVADALDARANEVNSARKDLRSFFTGAGDVVAGP